MVALPSCPGKAVFAVIRFNASRIVSWDLGPLPLPDRYGYAVIRHAAGKPRLSLLSPWFLVT